MIDQVKLLAEAISRKYAELCLTPQHRDYWVVDGRSGNLLGPYIGLVAALTLAKDLNMMVARNPGQVLNPFTTHDLAGNRVDGGI